jgi:hypothetical protein
MTKIYFVRKLIGRKSKSILRKQNKTERSRKMDKEKLKKQAKEILEIAQKYGVEQNFLFITTFQRYQVQLNILEDLEKTIEEDGSLVTKEYVKGRGNLYTHPAISEYNKTSTSANQTVATLIKIVKSLRKDEDDDEGEDELLQALGIK